MSLSTKTKRKILVVGFQTILLTIMWVAMYLTSRNLLSILFLGTFMTIVILFASAGLYKEDDDEDANLKS